MNLFRRILFLALLLTLAVVIFQNQQNLGMPLEFSFLQWTFAMVLGFWILLAFAAGVALFALIDAWRGMLLRLEIRRKDQEINRLKVSLADALEAANLKNADDLNGGHGSHGSHGSAPFIP
jgi:uncharacterized integral membrane protein